MSLGKLVDQLHQREGCARTTDPTSGNRVLLRRVRVSITADISIRQTSKAFFRIIKVTEDKQQDINESGNQKKQPLSGKRQVTSVKIAPRRAEILNILRGYEFKFRDSRCGRSSRDPSRDAMKLL